MIHYLHYQQLIQYLMSSSSIKINDAGYTPPDFIQNLFKPLTIPSTSENEIPSVKSFQSIPPNSLYTAHKANQLKQNPKQSPLKLMRSNSTIDEDRAIIRKLKIFYQTLMHNVKKDFEIQQLWQRFQQSLQNPFIFDEFIEDIREKNHHRESSPKKYELNLKNLEVEGVYGRRYSVEKSGKKKREKGRSEKKVVVEREERREEIRKEIGYVRKVMVHGEKFVKDK